MKIKDLIEQDVSCDVYDNVCEELGIAYCGENLTDEGKQHFADVLEYDVTLHTNDGYMWAIVDIDGDDWEHKLERAKDFFESIAGFCTPEEWDRWFTT